MGGLYRRAEAGLVAILIIVIALFFFGWLINVSQRECKSNRDCNSEAYCGADFSCHTYPNIQKTVIQYNLAAPAAIIGLAIIIAAIIFRRNKQSGEQKAPEQKSDVKAPQEMDAASPYYKSSNVKTP